MTTEDRKAFEEWLKTRPPPTPYEKSAMLKAWHAATARERERCANAARSVQIAYERSAHIASIDVADRLNAAAQAALEILIDIRSTDGGNTDDR